MLGGAAFLDLAVLPARSGRGSGPGRRRCRRGVVALPGCADLMTRKVAAPAASVGASSVRPGLFPKRKGTM